MSYLMILEVSQKQAYIFSSNKLKDNIEHSENICQVTDPEYLGLVAGKAGLPFSREGNLVYSGGGHTVLEFEGEKEAKDFAYEVSKTVRRDFPGLELFIRIKPYDGQATPGKNLELLAKALEEKKALRRSSFGQGSFGVEKLDATSRKAKPLEDKKKRLSRPNREEYVPEGYEKPWRFEDLGNSRDTSSFIAVVHIDGNAMGKRVEQLRKDHEADPWNMYKEIFENFSGSVDRDFKSAYREMADQIAESLKNGAGEKLDLKKKFFPVRQIILAGDDVCFVTEGRIGLEAARIFIEQLSGKCNAQDHKEYSACAGVAIVHQKYPFYKAYELAEMLCANAKKSIAEYGPESRACAIDWHIEFGELADSIESLRANYATADGCRLELRPYLLSAAEDVLEKETYRIYRKFRNFLLFIQREDLSYARGKMKELREALREGETASRYYLKSNLLWELAVNVYNGIYEETMDTSRMFSGEGLEGEIFVKTSDGEKRSLYFDGIEMVDTFVALD